MTKSRAGDRKYGKILEELDRKMQGQLSLSGRPSEKQLSQFSVVFTVIHKLVEAPRFDRTVVSGSQVSARAMVHAHLLPPGAVG